jgi:hypothetical protein
MSSTSRGSHDFSFESGNEPTEMNEGKG